jgi:hypothetical protein
MRKGRRAIRPRRSCLGCLLGSNSDLSKAHRRLRFMEQITMPNSFVAVKKAANAVYLSLGTVGTIWQTHGLSSMT